MHPRASPSSRKKNNVLRACDIKRVVDTVIQRASVDKFSVSSVARKFAERIQSEYSRYVDSSEEAESWDIWSTMFGGIPEQELAGLREYWAAFFLSQGIAVSTSE